MAGDNDDFSRVLVQWAIAQNAQSGTLAFDQSEFSRQPDASLAHQLTKEDIQEAEKALYASLTVGMYGSIINGGGEVQCIAAQFKNLNMRNSRLEPGAIEAALTNIIDNLDIIPGSRIRQLPVDISYSDGGSMVVNRGVRTFRIAGRVQRPANNKRSDAEGSSKASGCCNVL